MGPELAILLAPYGAVYVEVPKVACTSINVALAAMLGIDLVEGNPHETAFPAINCELSNQGPLFPGLFSFAFVRNPWDRLVSCYRDKILFEAKGFTHSTIRPGIADCLARFDEFRPGMSFEAFTEAVASITDERADYHFRSQHTFVANRGHAIAVDFLGRYESLAEDIVRVQVMAGLPGLELPRLQASTTPIHYHEFYNERTRTLVAERFATDIALFNYDF